MISKAWHSEIARDIISLGSIVFYSLVIARALVGPFWSFFTFLFSAALVLFITYLIYKEFESYLARGIILSIGTIFFYSEFIFTIFASVVYILMVASSYLLGNSILKIIKGIAFGLLATLAGYLITNNVFEDMWRI